MQAHFLVGLITCIANQFICGNGRSVGDQSQVRIPVVIRFNYGAFRVNGSYGIILDQAISTINFSKIYIFDRILCNIYMQFFLIKLLNIFICM